MKKYAILLLRLTLILLALPVLIGILFLFPKIIFGAFQHLSEGPVIALAVLGIITIVYLTTLPFFGTLFQTNKLLGFIENEEAFSMKAVHALKKIKRFAFSISALYLVSLPLFYILAEWDDAPGLILVGLVFVGAALVVAVFANVLEILLEEAIRMKNEIDLTV